jgi:hypothetical protein
LGTGNVKGFDELLGERFEEFTNSMRVPLDNVANSLAFRDCKGLAYRPSEDKNLFFCVPRGVKDFVVTMKCNGSFLVVSDDAGDSHIYINGNSYANSPSGNLDSIVTFNKGDQIRITITKASPIKIYAEEVNLLAFGF